MKCKGTFWEKIPLNPQKLFLILQRCCKKIKVLREFDGFFTKNLSRLTYFLFFTTLGFFIG